MGASTTRTDKSKILIALASVLAFLGTLFLSYLLFGNQLDPNIRAVLSVISGSIAFYIILATFDIIKEITLKGGGLEFTSKLEEVKEEVSESKKEIKERISELSQSIMTTQSMMVNSRATANPNQTVILGDILDKFAELTKDLKQDKISSVGIERKQDHESLLTTKVPEDTRRSFNRLSQIEKDIIALQEKITSKQIKKSTKELLKEADFQYAAKDFGRANEIYEQILEADPNNPRALLGKAIALIWLGKKEEAKKYYEKIPSKDKTPDEVSHIAHAYLQNREAGEALKILNEVEPKDRGNSYTYYNRACAYALLGQKKEALVDLEKAITLDPNHKGSAKNDGDFVSIKDDPRFVALIS